MTIRSSTCRVSSCWLVVVLHLALLPSKLLHMSRRGKRVAYCSRGTIGRCRVCHLSEWSSCKRRCGWKGRRGKIRRAWPNLPPDYAARSRSAENWASRAATRFSRFWLVSRWLTNSVASESPRLSSSIWRSWRRALMSERATFRSAMA